MNQLIMRLFGKLEGLVYEKIAKKTIKIAFYNFYKLTQSLIYR